MKEINLTPLESAITQLDKGITIAESSKEDELRRDGVIQRFEYTMDLSWKLLQRLLQQKFQVTPDQIRSKNDIFREAARVVLIDDAEAWIGYYAARNQTSHDYNPQKAQLVYEQAVCFLTDVQKLLAILKNAS